MSENDEILDKISKLSEEFQMFLDNEVENLIKKYNKKVQEQSNNMLFTIFDSIFKKFSFLYGISWDQFTENYNDGSPCTFEFRSIYIAFKEDFHAERRIDYRGSISHYKYDIPAKVFSCDLEDDCIELSDFKYYDYNDTETKQIYCSMVNAIKFIINDFENYKDDFKLIYGDHMRIKVLHDNTLIFEELTNHH